MRKTIFFAIFTGVMILGNAATGLEQPEYEVLHSDGKIEFRRYEPYIVAETMVDAENGYNSASNEGFRRLFKYITGSNTSESDIAMTAPVQMSMRSDGEKIDMTAPVQSSIQDGNLNVAFMVPNQFSLKTAPQPTDTRVVIKEVPSRLMAVIRYSGRWTESNRTKFAFRLQDYLEKNGVDVVSAPESAAYNAPFTPPFLRRNEIMVEIAEVPGSAIVEEGA